MVKKVSYFQFSVFSISGKPEKSQNQYQKITKTRGWGFGNRDHEEFWVKNTETGEKSPDQDFISGISEISSRAGF